MREMKSGSERPLHFDAAGEVLLSLWDGNRDG